MRCVNTAITIPSLPAIAICGMWGTRWLSGCWMCRRSGRELSQKTQKEGMFTISQRAGFGVRGTPWERDMVEKLEFYAEMADEVVSKEKDKIDLYLEIDRMMNCEYENPRELDALPWIKGRKFVTTAPADAANAAARAFAARAPILSVHPLSDEPEEYERVERMETALEWEFKRMNMIGKKPVHWQIVGDAMRYCKIALQVEYLPYAFKKAKKDNRIKSILRNTNLDRKSVV